MHWTNEIETIAGQYVNHAFGLPEDGPVPPVSSSATCEVVTSRSPAFLYPSTSRSMFVMATSGTGAGRPKPSKIASPPCLSSPGASGKSTRR